MFWILDLMILIRACNGRILLSRLLCTLRRGSLNKSTKNICYYSLYRFYYSYRSQLFKTPYTQEWACKWYNWLWCFLCNFQFLWVIVRKISAKHPASLILSCPPCICIAKARLCSLYIKRKKHGDTHIHVWKLWFLSSFYHYHCCFIFVFPQYYRVSKHCCWCRIYFHFIHF